MKIVITTSVPYIFKINKKKKIIMYFNYNTNICITHCCDTLTPWSEYLPKDFKTVKTFK